MVDSRGHRISLGKLCGEATGTGTGASAGTGASVGTGKATAAQSSPQSRITRVPIKRRNGRTPVIEVTFNGNRTFDMIVDSGASGTLITKTMAEALQIKPTGTIQAEIADGSTVEFRQGRVRSMGVQNAVIHDVEVAIADRMTVGLLGHDFFDNYDLRILANSIEFTKR
jgi:predicted aspartyl protease